MKRRRLSHEMTQIITPFKFNAEGVVPLIAQGWRQPTLGYACSEEVNAVGVVLFLRGTTPSVLRFLSVIHHKGFHCKCAFTEKAQHLRRWISLRTFTRGRLVPRQPRAIKNATRTELRGENIYIAKFIHWNNGTIPTQLRDETIVRVAWLIIKGEIV